MAKNDSLTRTLAVLPYRERILFPNTITNIDVGRVMSLEAIQVANSEGKYIFIVSQREKTLENVTDLDLYDVGVVALILNTDALPGNGVRITAKLMYRARIRSIYQGERCMMASVEQLNSEHGDSVLEEAYFRSIRSLVRSISQEDSAFSRELANVLEKHKDPDEYINIAAGNLHASDSVKQKLLEEVNLVKRMQLFEVCLNEELEISRLEKKITASVRQSMDKSQKEYYLRERIKAIHGELGDDVNELDTLRERLKTKGCPKDVEEKVLQELARMDKMQSSTPDYTVLRGYVDWVLDLPWKEETKDTELLSECAKVLEEDHYGLEKIKKRIIEYLAVLKLTKSMKAPILCFVGPPGVGKTSIATSIARALGRKFVRMSLGGVRDEAEIRGHRKTYVGAIPGRLIYGMKQAGSVNPVFLLDEIDKVSTDIQGDPASALLEVLDPEQNSSFRDRYLEVPYDLSKTLFITTANNLETIPAPLLDRMEIIQLDGYAPLEKLEIASRYLVPKMLKSNGVPEDKLTFTRGGLEAIVNGYTMEAGVRSLERRIGSICRKIAVKLADDPESPATVITEQNVDEYIDGHKYTPDEMLSESSVGVCTGLAWTSLGGTTLSVEVSTFPGKGEILLTGKLGEVMKESARIALTYIRANAVRFGIDPDVFAKTDVHIHVPEGATPKDGPSAGVTLTTALYSAFTGNKVRNDVAMTGEVTLRGNVLPIGGLKEKSLAALRIGIKTVVIPKKNERDILDIPAENRESIRFVPVSKVEEVLDVAIVTD